MTRIAAVVPAYRVAGQIAEVVRTMPVRVERIYVIDDACPEKSGDMAEGVGDSRVVVLRHTRNQGVGAAVKTGYARALQDGFDVVVKMDGDGQMDSAHLDDLLAPVIADAADYAKGNRFRDFAALRAMPRARLFGNSVLSFLLKWASGYWHVMDPNNGYTVIHRRALTEMDVSRTADRYFFESDMLIRLNIIGAVVADVPMPARYGAENSSLRIGRVLPEFLGRMVRGFVKRVLYRYFLYDFNMASVYILFGTPLFLFGVVFGLIAWGAAISSGESTPVGTVMLAVVPIIMGFQMLLQAVAIDIQNTPRR